MVMAVEGGVADDGQAAQAVRASIATNVFK
jgi:hypothetical protein